jgi:hypothetical protein
MKAGRSREELRRRENGWRIEDQSTEPLPYRVLIYGSFATRDAAAKYAVSASVLNRQGGHVHVTFPKGGEA